ncbi:diguanylate cyclase (GGDEF)-like protein [Shimia isoporae]|uniref:diguanylate cyclase n=1 Tax=Shimia isoporae TaxID=647720 RepID=A0A4R1NP02_9RHOB|nr:GGDEF domain-containing protein [Shimia isoporae]TCL09571.1 diguanylate cyclase (GGDEF)-like protein [Shimia isoporae]
MTLGTIKTRKQLIAMTMLWTGICVFLSYVICFPVAGVPAEPKFLITAILCPAIMAPAGAWVFGSLMMRLHQTSEELRHALERDHLTGIYNRQFLMTLLDSIRPDEDTVILMADIDHFKNINDTYGHFAGDKVIQKVAQTLEANCRATDMVARFGGEEFALVMRGAALGNSISAAERMRDAIAKQNIEHDGQILSVTISVGLAPRHGCEDISEIFKAADLALYKAKELGRDQVQIAA